VPSNLNFGINFDNRKWHLTVTFSTQYFPMKKTITTLFLGLILSTGWAQHAVQRGGGIPVAVDLHYLKGPVAGHGMNGANFDMDFYLSEKFATGFSFEYLGRSVSDTFGFTVGLPRVNYIGLGWNNQFDFWEHNRWRASGTFGLFFGGPTLVDRSQKIVNQNPDGSSSTQYKTIASNALFCITPGVEMGYSLLPNSNFDLQLSAKLRYRSAEGKTEFSNLDAFNQWYAGIGITLLGIAERSYEQHQGPSPGFTPPRPPKSMPPIRY
jgi:hypothetical protein